ncbi:MAG: sulfotransferase domain-containing protein [Planctomycetia bacterium]|nr:sulfotransferase domain-containing protein [Planctomycetia bacterium]
MLWLASYPRSGNTFLRIVLSEVYGLESSEFHDPQLQSTDREYLNYPVVKTHLLPGDLIPSDPEIPAVYIVRDGRDAVVSAARHHCDLVAPGMPFWSVLRWAIFARKGSFFGGWSRHVREWRKRAGVILRFEELIVDPIACAERIRSIYPLPAPRAEHVPSFTDLRSQKFDFGTGSSVMESSHFRERFFRRGKVGAWRDEMPWLHRLFFYCLHGRTLRKMGYV